MTISDGMNEQNLAPQIHISRSNLKEKFNNQLVFLQQNYLYQNMFDVTSLGTMPLRICSDLISFPQARSVSSRRAGPVHFRLDPPNEFLQIKAGA